MSGAGMTFHICFWERYRRSCVSLTFSSWVPCLLKSLYILQLKMIFLWLHERESRYWISGSKPFPVLNAHPVLSAHYLLKKKNNKKFSFFQIFIYFKNLTSVHIEIVFILGFFLENVQDSQTFPFYFHLETYCIACTYILKSIFS